MFVNHALTREDNLYPFQHQLTPSPPLEVLASLIWKSEKPKCLVIGGHLGTYVSLPI